MEKLINNVYLQIIFDLNQHGITVPLYTVINNPNCDEAPIIYKFKRKIYLNLQVFTYEQCIYQLAHEVIHSLFVTDNLSTQWIEELLASYYSYYALKDMYPNYLQARLNPKRIKAPKSWQDLTKYVKENLTYLESHPYAVYNHGNYPTVISSAFFDYFPSDVDFWSLLKIVVSAFNVLSTQTPFDSADLISKCASVFPEYKAENNLLNGFCVSK